MNRISMRNKYDEIEKFIRLNKELSKFLYRHDFFPARHSLRH